MGFAPLAHWRHVQITAQRPAVAWAPGLQELVDVHCPEAEHMVVVLDHRNPPTLAALYTACPPEEAQRLREKWAFHAPPQPGRWLNRAAIVLRVLRRPCLARRMPEPAPLRYETAAWVDRRTTAQATVDWPCTSTDARVKLQKLYPVLKSAD